MVEDRCARGAFKASGTFASWISSVVIVNRVNNALDATTADHGTVLRISAFVDDDDSVALRFEDDGPGFTDPSSAFESPDRHRRAGR